MNPFLTVGFKLDSSKADYSLPITKAYELIVSRNILNKNDF
jgi:hypothetical protein